VGTTFENVSLGYRIAMPQGYRRSWSRIFTHQDTLGSDYYTLRTAQEEKQLCLHDAGDTGIRPPAAGPDVQVQVLSDPNGTSAMEWATTPLVAGGQSPAEHHRAEATTVDGHEAVRLVEDNANAYTTGFVVHANDRIYWLTAPYGVYSPVTRTWLDDIATTFVAMAPAPFPSPPPTVAPLVATRELATSLAGAFAARDVDAIARSLPDCWINVYPLVNGQGGTGVLWRSVALFTQGLRDRFAAGDLVVTVDPHVQVTTRYGRTVYFARSTWTDAGRAARVDLSFEQDADGSWRWNTAVHRYTRAELTNGTCALGREPWSTPGATSQGWCR